MDSHFRSVANKQRMRMNSSAPCLLRNYYRCRRSATPRGTREVLWSNSPMCVSRAFNKNILDTSLFWIIIHACRMSIHNWCRRTCNSNRQSCRRNNLYYLLKSNIQRIYHCCHPAEQVDLSKTIVGQSWSDLCLEGERRNRHEKSHSMQISFIAWTCLLQFFWCFKSLSTPHTITVCLSQITS